MVRNEGDKLTRVIICSPGREYSSPKNLETHNFSQIPDPEKANIQHNRLKTQLEKFGCEVIRLKELHGHPNSVFTRDTAVCTPHGYIQLRMGLESRRGEDEWMSDILRSLKIPLAGNIEEPGTLEGGDIILAGSVAFIGRSSRNTEEGEKQIAKLLIDMNYEIRFASIPTSFLHIGGAMSMVGPNRVLYCQDVFLESFFDGFDTIPILSGQNASANVICLGNNEVIADSNNIGAINALTENGVTVHPIALSEFAKGNGGPSCLVLPVDRKLE